MLGYDDDKTYKTINLTYNYDKLKDNEFTTIRGKTHFKKYSIGEVVYIDITDVSAFVSEIIGLEVNKIRDIPINDLKKDIAPFGMETRRDFIDFLNKFRRFNKLQSDEDLVTIIKLKRVL